MTDNLYYYSATVKKVVDGDTIHCQVDLGFGVNFYDMDFRFAGINAPETRGETRVAGLESKAFLTDLLLNKPVIVQTIKDKQEKYG